VDFIANLPNENTLGAMLPREQTLAIINTRN
jgi:hypothetical protein